MNSYTPFSDASFQRSSRAENINDYRASQLMRPGRVVTSETLFRGTQEIGIEHAGSLYRLRITRQGKLILNK